MRTDLAICILLLMATGLLPLLVLRWRRGRALNRDSALGGALIGGICAYPVATVLWLLLAVVGGAIHGLCGDGFGRGLRRGFDLAVPLDERDDLRPWGLLPVVGCALAANGAAGWILARRPDRVRPGPAPAPGRDR